MHYLYISLKLFLYPVDPEIDGHNRAKIEIGIQFVDWFLMSMTYKPQ